MKSKRSGRKRSAYFIAYSSIAIVAILVVAIGVMLAPSKPAGAVGRLEAGLQSSRPVPLPQFLSLLADSSNSTGVSYNITYAGQGNFTLKINSEILSVLLPIKLDAVVNGTAFRLMFQVSAPEQLITNGGAISPTKTYNITVLGNGTALYLCGFAHGYEYSDYCNQFSGEGTPPGPVSNTSRIINALSLHMVNESQAIYTHTQCTKMNLEIQSNTANLNALIVDLSNGRPPLYFSAFGGALSACLANSIQNLLPLNVSISVLALFVPTPYSMGAQNVTNVSIGFQASIKKISEGKQWSVSAITALPQPPENLSVENTSTTTTIVPQTQPLCYSLPTVLRVGESESCGAFNMTLTAIKNSTSSNSVSLAIFNVSFGNSPSKLGFIEAWLPGFSYLTQFGRAQINITLYNTSFADQTAGVEIYGNEATVQLSPYISEAVAVNTNSFTVFGALQNTGLSRLDMIVTYPNSTTTNQPMGIYSSMNDSEIRSLGPPLQPGNWSVTLIATLYNGTVISTQPYNFSIG